MLGVDTGHVCFYTEGGGSFKQKVLTVKTRSVHSFGHRKRYSFRKSDPLKFYALWGVCELVREFGARNFRCHSEQLG